MTHAGRNLRSKPHYASRNRPPESHRAGRNLRSKPCYAGRNRAPPLYARHPALQYIFHSVGSGFILGQLMREISSCLGICSRSVGFVFTIIEVTVGFAPVVPAKRMNVVPKIAVKENCFGIFSPRAAKIDGSLGTIAF